MSGISPNLRVITMDGPSASGKSSVAKRVAANLGWLHVNTGNMYRAATWAVLQAGADPQKPDAVLRALGNVDISTDITDGQCRVLVQGKNVEADLNSEAVNKAVSYVSRIPEVRARLVALQRELGTSHSVVMEGRDIGTIVFPDSPCKFYIDASESVRLKRRGNQGQTDALKQRDLIDSTRKTAPLRPAPDAVVIDSSDLTLDEVVTRVMEVLRDRSFPPRAHQPPRMSVAYWLGRAGFRFIATALFNHRVIGRENLDVPGGALIVSNHTSFVDPPCVGLAFNEPIHFLARKTLFKSWLGNLIIRAWNAIPVDQDRPDMASLKTVIRVLQRGEKVLVFPEGERSFDGQVKKGQPGVGLIVHKAHVPVIPVRLHGAHEALPRGGSLFRPADITLVVGKPWHYNPADYTETGKELYQRISDDLIAQIMSLHIE